MQGVLLGFMFPSYTSTTTPPFAPIPTLFARAPRERRPLQVCRCSPRPGYTGACCTRRALLARNGARASPVRRRWAGSAGMRLIRAQPRGSGRDAPRRLAARCGQSEASHTSCGHIRTSSARARTPRGLRWRTRRAGGCRGGQEVGNEHSEFQTCMSKNSFSHTRQTDLDFNVCERRAKE